LQNGAPIPPEALPLEPDGFLTDGEDGAGFDELVAALSGSETDDTDTAFVSSPSVVTATRGSDPVTSFAIVQRLLRSHPDYGGGAFEPAGLDGADSSAKRRTPEEWLAAVRRLYRRSRVPELHGRLLIDGLARCDDLLEARLRSNHFLEKLRAE